MNFTGWFIIAPENQIAHGVNITGDITVLTDDAYSIKKTVIFIIEIKAIHFSSLLAPVAIV